jgi:transcriptional regulator with XRE-family HTH domain
MNSIYDLEYTVLISCLKDLRIQSKMTQQELSTYLGCSQAYISKYEQGQRRLDIVEVRNICIQLGSSLPKLVDEYEKRLKERKSNGYRL